MKNLYAIFKKSVLTLAIALTTIASAMAQFSGGNGTEANPYIITTAAQLAQLATYVNNSTSVTGYRAAHYQLANDIDLSDYGENFNGGNGWIPIGVSNNTATTFGGVFDGNSKKITGLYINPLSDIWSGTGLFGTINWATIKNLGVESCYINITNDLTAYSVNVGCVVAFNEYGTVSNCYSTGTISSTGGMTCMGGIAGLNRGWLIECYSTANISIDCESNVVAGGVVGVNQGTVEYCYSTGTVSTVSRMSATSGGVVGINSRNVNYESHSGIVINSHSSGTVTAEATLSLSGLGGAVAGGVVGDNNWEVSNCYFTGSVSASGYSYGHDFYRTACSGGVVGRSGDISNCYSTGSVSAHSDTYMAYAGGIVGDFYGNLTNCYSKSNVSATSDQGHTYAGGVIGWANPPSGNNTDISNCYSIGVISVNSPIYELVGGIIGENHRNIRNCAALNPSLAWTIAGNTPVYSDSCSCGRIAGASAFNAGYYGFTINNIAYLGMEGIACGVSGLNTKNGADISKDTIYADGTLGGRFTSEGGWTTRNGRLPGLFGKTVDMPEHLRKSGYPYITTDMLPNGTVGESYSQTLEVDSETDVTWSLYGGNLPTGLTISAAGIISGTPANIGTFNFIVKAENSINNDTKDFTIYVNGPPVITTSTLPNGKTTALYSQTLKADGNKPITWTLQSGNLPNGLTLLPSGVISGTTTTTGTFNFTVMATNSYGSDTKALSIVVAVFVIDEFPFEEDFEGPFFPPEIWTVYNNPGAEGWRKGGNNTLCSPHSGEYMIGFHDWQNSGALITPRIVSGGIPLKFSFWMYRDDRAIYASNFDRVNIYLGGTTNLSNATLLLTVHRCTMHSPIVATNGWYQYSVILPTASMASAYVFIEGVHAGGTSFYVDDISIIDKSDLIDGEVAAILTPASGLMVNPTSNEQVKVLLKNNGVLPLSEFNLKLELDGNEIVTEAYSGAPIPAEGTIEYIFTQTLDLSAEGTYQITATIIVENDEVPENNSKTITVQNLSPDIPYSCNFENEIENGKWTLLNGTQTNKWYIGSVVSYGTGKSLYISRNGTTHQYDNGMTSYVYAYRALTFETPGVYSVSFNWICSAEYSFDNVRAFLVPDNILLQAGNAYGNTASTNDVPENWIAVSPILSGRTTWQDFINENIYVQSAGVYKLVFFWKNNYYDGYNPPAAIDNIVVTEVSMPEVATIPYTDGFEDDAENAQWTLLNGTQTNKWYIGSVVAQAGAKSLYISNNGTAHNYTINGATSYVYAYRRLNFDESGRYSVSFNWICDAESNWDNFRVFLVPDNISLEAGNAYGNTSSTNNVPANWIAVSGVLNDQTTWQNFINENIYVQSAGIYKLVFFWKNDNSDGSQPPAAIDNIVVVKPETFVAVTNITGVPETATAGTPLTLTGTVVPSNATNQTIVWSVQSAGTTGATISPAGGGGGWILNTTAAGTVTVRATIANGASPTTPYTKDFSITVSLPFVPVTNITGVPETATAGTPLTLTGTVVPSNATNQTIVWSVNNAGTTGATLTGNILNTTSIGVVEVTATIIHGISVGINYTQNFNITVTRAQLGGSVLISGTAVFGETLTAVTTALTSSPPLPSLGTLTYQWKRNGSNVGTNSATYTLVVGDIANSISVEITAANCDGNVTSNPTATIAKATQMAPETPTLASKTETSITLNSITGCEYSRDGGDWQISTTFSGLTPNTTYSFRARRAETDTHLASPQSSEATFNTGNVGIVETQCIASLQIYPNPTTGELTITNYELEITSVEILDMAGRKVSSHHLIAPSSHHLINISHLSAGVYFVKICTESGEVVRKVVKE